MFITVLDLSLSLSSLIRDQRAAEHVLIQDLHSNGFRKGQNDRGDFARDRLRSEITAPSALMASLLLSSAGSVVVCSQSPDSGKIVILHWGREGGFEGCKDLDKVSKECAEMTLTTL